MFVMNKPFYIGIVGGGQLGRMIAFAARRMGIQAKVLDPDPNCPAAGIAEVFVADYADGNAVREFSKQCDVVTIEFENLSVPALQQSICPVHPSPKILSICQDRIQEKLFLHTNGLPVAKFLTIPRFSSSTTEAITFQSPNEQIIKEPVDTYDQWLSVVMGTVRKWIEREFNGSEHFVLKSARLGYDGKSQKMFTSYQQFCEYLKNEWNGSHTDWVLEQFIHFKRELSILVARNHSGETQFYPLVENTHRNHILFSTEAPAKGILPHTQTEALKIATILSEKLDLIGLLCIELFELNDGSLIINELAPRPHNSGHWSIEGAHCSQFEQIVRIISRLPLGSTDLVCHQAAMVNLLGDLWVNGNPPWDKILRLAGVHLHLYEKREARPGRKMGHLTTVGVDAFERAMNAYSLLTNC